jgi:hypothetical protein
MAGAAPRIDRMRFMKQALSDECVNERKRLENWIDSAEPAIGHEAAELARRGMNAMLSAMETPRGRRHP